jgi:rhamnosyl/mannosyltransferase
VPPADGAALAGAIRALLADPVLAGRLGGAGRRRVEKDFAAPMMVQRVMQIYVELLSRPRRRRA